MAIGASARLRTNAALLLVSSLFVASGSAAVYTSQFRSFYPQHGDKYAYILRRNCSQQYANYLTGRPQDFERDWLGGGGEHTVLVQPVVKCLLDNVSEYIKAASSSAQVILGLTPTILSLLGASSDELAMVVVVGRRPLLGLILSFASPGVFMERVFGFRDPKKMLQLNNGQFEFKTPGLKSRDELRRMKRVVALGQYLVALGAAANIAHLSLELGIRTVCCWWAETIYAPLVWTFLSIPLHFLGIFVLWLRVRRTDVAETAEPPPEGFQQFLGLLTSFVKFEWVPAMAGDLIRVLFIKENKLFVSWSWALSTAAILHLLFGSSVLSGLLFIGPRDALLIIARYLISALSCRMLVAFELAGMRSMFTERVDLEQGMGHEMEMVQRGNGPGERNRPRGSHNSPVQDSAEMVMLEDSHAPHVQDWAELARPGGPVTTRHTY
ncbi:hypothetical protein SAMD00023353_1300910 [Rosellinia necatrix]|uniref:Integral membrane protein n=1 Tax=Rosellinia necatrix TaxID=77044 RepID=A0A1W2TCF6_ROSNE|nr:hypothetical protein SAMD00023353_1300910 [Rosellinia necatrix]